MSDTRLNGSGDYQTRQVSDDYRAQEFPRRNTNINYHILFESTKIVMKEQ